MSSRIRKREPSGRLSRAEAEDPAISPTAARRLRDEAARRVSGAEYGTELGRLWLAGQIIAAQYRAGQMWHGLVADYLRAIGAPPPYPPPGPIAALGTVAGRDPGDDPPVDSKEGRRLLEGRRRIEKRMAEAEAILDQAGPYVKLVVRSVCEEHSTLAGHSDLISLRDGLDRLARHWRLSK